MRTSLLSAIALAVATPSLALAQQATPSAEPSAPAPAPAPASAPAAPAKGLTLELTTLQLLRDRGIISAADYDSTVQAASGSVGDKGGNSLTLAAGKWSTTFYGFLETDLIYDSTQSFNDAAGTNQVARGSAASSPGGTNVQSYPGDNGRMQMSIRNSRLGMIVRAPELGAVRTSGVLEMDFLGYEPAIPTSTEASFFNNPTMRLRHGYVRLDNPFVNVLVGQTWHAFGFEDSYQPNTVEIQGVPGELYARTAQVRLTHDFVFGNEGAPGLQLMAAALRPPQRDAVIPDLVGGVRFTVPGFSGVHTSGATATQHVPASIAISGDLRNYKLPMFEPQPTSSLSLSTYSASVGLVLPVVPAREHGNGNAFTIVGQAVYGQAIADLYNGMTAGLTFPTIPQAAAQTQGQVWPQDVDNGLVVYDNNPPLQYGQPSTASLHPIIWESFLVGGEYYLPVCDGCIWLSGNYSLMASPNIANYTQPSAGASDTSSYASAWAVRKYENWWDVNVFYDPLPFFRTGIEFASFKDHYVDGYAANNYRAQLSAWFRF